MFSLCLVWLVYFLVCFSLGLSCMGLFVTLGLDWLFSFHVGGIFNCNLFKSFLIPLFFLFFWDLFKLNVCVFDIVTEGLWDYPQFFSVFLLYSALQKLFPPFYLLTHWFVLLLQNHLITSPNTSRCNSPLFYLKLSSK